MTAGQIKPRFITTLLQARYLGRGYGSVINANDALLHDLSPAFTDFSGEIHEVLQQPRLPRTRALAGTSFVLGAPFCSNFHHWLLDTLPRLGMLREAGHADRIDHYLLPHDTRHNWHREVLAWLGISDDRIVRTGPEDHLVCEELIVPSYAEPGRDPEQFDYTPEGLNFVRELARPHLPPDFDLGPHLVISREKAGSRRLVDGETIHAELTRHGFTKVLLEELSLAQQAACFQRAQTVIFPTGGNLANLVFCAPGTKVIELFHPAYLPTFCLPLCQALQLEYHALVESTPAGNTPRHHDRGKFADIKIPVGRLLEHAL